MNAGGNLFKDFRLRLSLREIFSSTTGEGLTASSFFIALPVNQRFFLIF